ncbi:TPA: ead/Ea22-like family protein [Escherichia coli]|nr:ead/Ea22-like family protein [Escherichia coli]
MSKIDYQVLREAAVAIETVATPQKLLAFRMKVTPQVVLALLDERDALNERLAELEADLAGLAEDHQKATESIKQADAAVKLAHEKFSALAAENAGLKDTLSAVIDRSNEPDYQSIGMGCGVEDNGLQTDGYNACEYGWLEAMDRIYSEVIPDTIPETPATDAFLAEVRAQCLNAFIQHHSAELDAHIKNGGEQFDEKSVRIRDIIVSARLFREQIRKGAAL